MAFDQNHNLSLKMKCMNEKQRIDVKFECDQSVSKGMPIMWYWNVWIASLPEIPACLHFQILSFKPFHDLSIDYLK